MPDPGLLIVFRVQYNGLKSQIETRYRTALWERQKLIVAVKMLDEF